MRVVNYARYNHVLLVPLSKQVKLKRASAELYHLPLRVQKLLLCACTCMCVVCVCHCFNCGPFCGNYEEVREREREREMEDEGVL